MLAHPDQTAITRNAAATVPITALPALAGGMTINAKPASTSTTSATGAKFLISAGSFRSGEDAGEQKPPYGTQRTGIDSHKSPQPLADLRGREERPRWAFDSAGRGTAARLPGDCASQLL